MKPSLIATVLLLCAIGLSPAMGQQPLVFTAVNVVPMDEERVLPEQTVVINHGRIVSIGPADEVEIPQDSQVIDGTGKYLMPGLAEMHAHVPGGWDDQAQYREDVLFLYLANGVTLARGMAGHPVQLETRSRLARGELLGPRLITAGPGFGGNIPSAGHGARLVREQAEAGYDFLKIFWGPSRETFDAIAEAADASGIRMSGHVPGDVGVPRALEAGYASIDHFDAYMPELVDPSEVEGIDGGFFGYRLAPYAQSERIEEIARQTREAGVWNVPTESIMYSAFILDLDTLREERPEFQYMPERVVEGWFNWVRNFRAGNDYDAEAGQRFVEVRLELIRALHEAGAGLLLGSDAPQWFNVPGFSIHHEMRIMADAGLSPYEVLKTGTVHPAEFFGEEEVFGRVAEGLRADLVLLEANPLEDLEHVRQVAGVVRHGRWVSRQEIDERLAEIAGRNGG